MSNRLKTVFILAMAAGLLAGAMVSPADSQQGKVLLADSRTVTIDIGADRELRPGMEADIYRETEPIIHPQTKENLGRHRVRIARIRVDKVDTNTSVGLYLERFATVRNGDIVQGLSLAPTYEEEIRTEVTEARAEIKALARGLAEEIRTNQKEIAKIQSTLQRVDRTEQRMSTLINSVMNMRERMVAIEGRLDSLSHHTTLVDSISEVQRIGVSEFRELGVLTRDEDEAVYLQVGDRVFLLNLQTEKLEEATPQAVATTASQPMAKGMDDAMAEASMDEELFPEDETEEETPFYLAYWWIAPLLGVLVGVLLFLKKMMGRNTAAVDDEDDSEDEPFPEADAHEDELELPEEIPDLEEVETAEGEEA